MGIHFVLRPMSCNMIWCPIGGHRLTFPKGLAGRDGPEHLSQGFIQHCLVRTMSTTYLLLRMYALQVYGSRPGTYSSCLGSIIRLGGAWECRA